METVPSGRINVKELNSRSAGHPSINGGGGGGTAAVSMPAATTMERATQTYTKPCPMSLEWQEGFLLRHLTLANVSNSDQL